MSETISNNKMGFLGKLPKYGDFLSRNLPGSFTTPWDRWLEIAINESQIRMGDKWLGTYLTSPLWRFTLSSGICGSHIWTGLLMPSVDKVGRYYPLTLALQLPPNTDPVALIMDNEAWFNQCEELALSSLLDSFELDAFQNEMESIPPPVIQKSSLSAAAPKAVVGQYFALPCSDPFGDGISNLAGDLQIPFPHSLWWTHGSQKIQQSLLITSGLPTSFGYSSMLDGNWEQGGWKNSQ